VVVGLAEIGDKTQILSLMLAARFLRPLPIICGILVPTLANHDAAGFVGTLFGSLFGGPRMCWILAASFLSVGVVIGTTCGMMLANIPAVFIGDRLAERLPMKAIRVAAAIVFAALAMLTLIRTVGWTSELGGTARSL
jgi:putative Ca2+/H+ antiporter (TMEM165/GDT1 family)